METGDSSEILCGACDVEVKAIIDADGDTSNLRIRCPRCGAEADLKQAVAEAAQYQADNAIRGALSGLRGTNVTVKGVPYPKPKFILG
jgi:DNA-directed RNA polymerase subunit RPC12/RpoP